MKMAVKKSRIFKGSPVVLKFEFDESLLAGGELKGAALEKVDTEWEKKNE